MREEHVSSSESSKVAVERKDIKGYVTVVYDRHWWLACVLASNSESGKILFTKILLATNLYALLSPTHPMIAAEMRQDL